MDLKEITAKFSALNIEEERSADDSYVELVFLTKDIAQWDKIIIDSLGPAVKPPGIEPSEDDQKITEDYGGIYGGQTLFKKEFDSFSIIAMFWPWQDGAHTTLKMALVK